MQLLEISDHNMYVIKNIVFKPVFFLFVLFIFNIFIPICFLYKTGIQYVTRKTKRSFPGNFLALWFISSLSKTVLCTSPVASSRDSCASIQKVFSNKRKYNDLQNNVRTNVHYLTM